MTSSMTLSDFISRLKKIPGRLDAKNVLMVIGDHFSNRKTLESETVERRMYNPGDDLKFLDWKQYARSDKFFVKMANTPSKGRTLLLLDNSASMHQPQGKFECAILFFFGLLYSSLISGDSLRVGLIGEAPSLKVNSMKIFQNIFTDWYEKQQIKKTKIDLDIAIEQTYQAINRNSFIILVSDLYVSVDRLKDFMAILKKKNCHGLFVQTLEESEISGFHFQGSRSLVDIESGARHVLSSDENDILKRKLKTAISLRKNLILNHGLKYYLLNTQVSCFAHLARILSSS